MTFYRASTEFSLVIFCALMALSLRFHGALNACTAHSRRPHCADGVLKTRCRDFPPFRSFGQGPVECEFVPYLFCLKPNNKISVALHVL